ncbi:MAG: LysM peptidoglycan-binding domain-containing protein [Chloroflexota bacterium]
MLRFARTRRSVARSVLAVVLLTSVATPAAAGDDLIVQRGDTLWDIALEHGTTVDALVTLNGISDPSLIRIGQRIVLHPPSAPSSPPPAAPAPSAPAIHVVQLDETLWGIAVQYGTTVAALVEANQISNPSLIRIGQTLAVPQLSPLPPPPAAEPPPPAPAPTAEHVVQAGETLWAISRLHGTTVEAIVDANLLANPSFIRTGQRLVIPGAPASAPAAVTNSSMPPDMAAKVAHRTEARGILLEAASEFGVPGPFVLAVSWHESGWQSGVVSSAGAVGLMQLMPDTADWVADSLLHEVAAIDDPRWNARAGVRLLAFYMDRYQGDRAKTLAAYFQGMASVDQIGVLVSTVPYSDSILTLEQIFSR